MKRCLMVLATIIAFLSACARYTPTHTSTRVDVLGAANQTLAASIASPTTNHSTRSPTDTTLSETASENRTPTPDIALPTTSRVPSPQITPASCISPVAETQVGSVVKIISGDCIEVAIDGQNYQVRYIGIDSPNFNQSNEAVEYLAPEAKAMNASLVENQTVILVKDTSESDKYNRLLRYVFTPDLDGVFVNYELVRRGFAASTTFRPDVACASTFNQAEGSAKQEKIGIWAPAIPTLSHPITVTNTADTVGIQITKIFYNGVAGDNEPDEYIELRNDGPESVQLQDWTLSDNAKHTFTFPNFLMQPNQICRVYTNEIHPESCGFSFEFMETAIWNNTGDCAYIKDSGGNLVTEKCY